MGNYQNILLPKIFKIFKWDTFVCYEERNHVQDQDQMFNDHVQDDVRTLSAVDSVASPHFRRLTSLSYTLLPHHTQPYSTIPHHIHTRPYPSIPQGLTCRYTIPPFPRVNVSDSTANLTCVNFNDDNESPLLTCSKIPSDDMISM